MSVVLHVIDMEWKSETVPLCHAAPVATPVASWRGAVHIPGPDDGLGDPRGRSRTFGQLSDRQASTASVMLWRSAG